MRMSGFLNNEDFEARKRLIQRREAKDAYKRNATYNQVKTSSMLKILEDLLSGKTEKELFTKNQAQLTEGIQTNNISILQTKDENNSLLELPLENEESIKNSEIMHSTVNEVSSNEEENVNRISHKRLDFLIPEVPSQTNKRDKINYSANRSLGSNLYERTYTKAVSSYIYQMQMAQNGFQLEQPKYSHIA